MGDHLVLGGGAERIAHPAQCGGKAGPVPLQLVENGAGFPEEHARVPGEVAGGQKCLGRVEVGLLAELDDPVDGDPVARVEQLAALDVAISGLGSGRLDSEGHQGCGILLDHRDRGADRAQEGRDGLDRHDRRA